MTEQVISPHLRLIATRNEDWGSARKPSLPKDVQLSFPYHADSTVFFLSLGSMRNDEFVRIMVEYTPRWIIDVRAVPRLDTVAASRLAAFALFKKFSASYIDLFGRLQIKSYRVAESNPAYWGKEIFNLLKNFDRKGPYFFLFDNEQLLKVAAEILPEAMQPVVGKDASFVHLQHSKMSIYFSGGVIYYN